MFILDSSGSVGRDGFWNVLNFTYNTINQLDIDSGYHRIGLITFSDNAQRYISTGFFYIFLLGLTSLSTHFRSYQHGVCL